MSWPNWSHCQEVICRALTTEGTSRANMVSALNAHLASVPNWLQDQPVPNTSGTLTVSLRNILDAEFSFTAIPAILSQALQSPSDRSLCQPWGSHVSQGVVIPALPAIPIPPPSLLHHSSRHSCSHTAEGNGCLVTSRGFWPNILRIMKPTVLLTAGFKR